MSLSDDMRAVAKFGTPMINGMTREDLLNTAAALAAYREASK